jgi:ribosome modulation factor
MKHIADLFFNLIRCIDKCGLHNYEADAVVSFHQGYIASADGKEKGTNPYRFGHVLNSFWYQGFQEAKVDSTVRYGDNNERS